VKIAITAVVVIVFLALALFLFWPMSFAPPNDLPLTVTFLSLNTTQSVSATVSTDYVVLPDTETFAEINEILNRHSFRRTLLTFTGGTSMAGHDLGFMFLWYSDEYMISFSGSGHVEINSRIYHIGRSDVRDIMDEVRSVLTDRESYRQ